MGIASRKRQSVGAAAAILSLALSLRMALPASAQFAGAIAIDMEQSFLINSGLPVADVEELPAPAGVDSQFMNFGGRSAGAENAPAQFDSPEDSVAGKSKTKRIQVRNGPRVPAATTPGAARAVKFALEQLGKPYVAYTKGPDTYDCSGLTKAAWKQAGVSLAHYSLRQYRDSQHVSVDELQPGDLMFFAAEGKPISHVAMYIEGDTVIEAPAPNKFIKFSNWRTKREKKFVGAARPRAEPDLVASN